MYKEVDTSHLDLFATHRNMKGLSGASSYPIYGYLAFLLSKICLGRPTGLFKDCYLSFMRLRL